MSRTVTFATTRTRTIAQPVRTVSLVESSRQVTIQDSCRTITFTKPTRQLSIVRNVRDISLVRPARTITFAEGPRGPAGASSDGSVQVTWNSPASESANTIAISGTVTDANNDPVLSAVDFQVLVSDGAADGEPSSTATITAGASGTILAGSGTASVVIRTDTGEFAISVNETAVGHRYLWVSGAGHERLLVRATDGVQELIFA